jgi:hypothetical protein
MMKRKMQMEMSLEEGAAYLKRKLLKMESLNLF